MHVWHSMFVKYIMAGADFLEKQVAYVGGKNKWSKMLNRHHWIAKYVSYNVPAALSCTTST